MSSEQAQLLDEIRARLADVGIADPLGEAELIVRAAAGQSEQLLREHALALAERRLGGQALAEVLGRVTFLGVEMLVEPGVIVPRVETELVGQAAIDALRELVAANPDARPRVIDMCCGAGNLACAIAVQVPSAHLWASDLTEDCVRVTRANIAHLGLGDRVQVFQGDLFEPLAELELGGSMDMVVCNPPYISSGKLDTDSAALCEHEPREAFDGGAYGLSIHQKVIRTSVEYLRPGGWLMFEMGLGQERQIKALFGRARAYESVQFRSDAADQPRVAIAKKKAE